MDSVVYYWYILMDSVVYYWDMDGFCSLILTYASMDSVIFNKLLYSIVWYFIEFIGFCNLVADTYGH